MGTRFHCRRAPSECQCHWTQHLVVRASLERVTSARQSLVECCPDARRAEKSQEARLVTPQLGRMTIHYADPKSLDGWDPSRDLGFPGVFPVHPRHPADDVPRAPVDDAAVCGVRDGRRIESAISLPPGQGVSGLSVAFDLPTQMGYDSDHQLAAGEVGRVGVAIDSIEDMADSSTASRSIASRLDDDQRDGHHPAGAVRRRRTTAGRRVDRRSPARSRTTSSRNTSRAGPTSTRHASRSGIVTDIFAFCERELPQWNTISISGYHIREAGSTAVEEVAFTFANAIAYVQAAIDAGLDVNRFGQRLSFFLQRPQRFSRGNRQVSRRAADVGAHHARALRRHESRAPSSFAFTRRRPAAR